MKKTQLNQIKTLAQELINPVDSHSQEDFQAKMAVLLKRPKAKTFLIQMLDVAFRSSSPSLTSGYIHWLFKTNNAYRYLFSQTETTMLRLFQVFGRHVPGVSIPIMLQQIQNTTQDVVFFEGEETFLKHAKKRQLEGSTLNINLIGEALIDEHEARERINQYKSLLHQEEILYISVKMSTLYSQIHPLAFKQNISELKVRLSELYQELLTIEESTSVAKFVNVDMEEYHDLWLNIKVFTQTLDQAEFKNLRAGIVLQAYIPDSYQALQYLKNWAIQRVENGGAPIKIRLVKGANLEMEHTESSHRSWPLVTFNSKVETDAHYKKILRELLTPESVKSIHVGVASHNIFDISYSLGLVKKHDIWHEVEFEILEGMAPELNYNLRQLGAKLVIYTPLVSRKNYNAAIAYLVRRLDEGTQKGNFLKEGFQLQPGSDQWNLIWDQFRTSIALMETIDTHARRTQDRNTPYPALLEHYQAVPHFINEPDTDWTLENNRQWIQSKMQDWKGLGRPFPSVIPLIYQQYPEESDLEIPKTRIPHHTGETPWEYQLATSDIISEFIADSSSWQITPFVERQKTLSRAAQFMRERRSRLIGTALMELGKQVDESDVEVSEAIDFANYYAQSILKVEDQKLYYNTQGIHLVLSPWNFPIAIPIGGVIASLAAGKRVILKPSTNAAATAYVACQCLWDAGVPRNALGFLPSENETYHSFLKSNCPFDAVILTGATATAKFLLKQNPLLPLYAETGGKNSTYIEDLSDHEQAIDNLIQSSFSNAGQKCSATSLLILQEELYNSDEFKQKLCNAVKSLKVGDPWQLDTKVGFLSTPVNERILELMKQTSEKDWLLKPQLRGDFVLTPGILWGVENGDYYHQTEFFGPLLGVMKAKDVNHAVELANGVTFGLTSGIESLNPTSVEYWTENIHAGNLYINRSTTGAIVQRQPFGGMKQSCFGFGMKAGGPNYVLQFLNLEPYLEENGLEPSLAIIKQHYQEAMDNEFSQARDVSLIRGQHNIYRYLKVHEVLLLIDVDTNKSDIEKVKIACKVMEIPLEIHTVPKGNEVVNFIQTHQKYFSGNRRIRNLSKNLPDEFRQYCHENAYHIYSRIPHSSGRVELLNYIEEQSISHNYHRYGNMMGIQPGEFNIQGLSKI
tara:strand:+ start:1613 stop:5032 length:3420 start_codon:yes stop_codon:yes gene_type:complete